MPFNVNAVTHAIFGIIFCNTVFALYDRPAEPEQNKSEDGDTKKKEPVNCDDSKPDEGIGNESKKEK